MKGIFRRVGFFTAFIIPVLVVAGVYGGGLWMGLPVVFSFFVLPLFDHIVGEDTANVPEDRLRLVSEDRYYRFITHFWVLLQLAFLLWSMYVISTGTISGVWIQLLFTFNCALVTGGVGITVAHELGHKKSKIERFYGKALLMMVCYMHYYIEHNRGHHVRVATPDDPSTARKNESFYRFWIRSVTGSYNHALRLERARLTKRSLRFLSVQNEMIRFAILPLVFCAAATLFVTWLSGTFTWAVPAFFFLQSLLAFSLLELVNYIEHYGIQRKEIAPGKYERVNPLHSWNSSHLLSNFFLFQLQRHSDHHVYAHKRYQVLDHHDESPQLPFGYPTMLLIALVPPLWFRLMNKRLEAWSAGIFSTGQASVQVSANES